MAKVYTHPKSKETVIGIRLKRGSIRDKNDVYAAPSGKWERCPLNLQGSVLETTETTWVRKLELANRVVE